MVGGPIPKNQSLIGQSVAYDRYVTQLWVRNDTQDLPARWYTEGDRVSAGPVAIW